MTWSLVAARSRGEGSSGKGCLSIGTPHQWHGLPTTVLGIRLPAGFFGLGLVTNFIVQGLIVHPGAGFPGPAMKNIASSSKFIEGYAEE